MRITIEGPLGLCTLEITNTPNTFTHQYEHAAKLLNRRFVGYSKRLEICIPQTILCVNRIASKGTVRPEMEVWNLLATPLWRFDLYLIGMFSRDQTSFYERILFPGGSAVIVVNDLLATTISQTAYPNSWFLPNARLSLTSIHVPYAKCKPKNIFVLSACIHLICNIQIRYHNDILSKGQPKPTVSIHMGPKHR